MYLLSAHPECSYPEHTTQPLITCLVRTHTVHYTLAAEGASGHRALFRMMSFVAHKVILTGQYGYNQYQHIH